MLLIGVGGSGGKTLQLLHRELRWRLRDSGWTEGVPAGWQFIHIDVPYEPDTALRDQAVTVNTALVGGQYVPLAPKAVTKDDAIVVPLDVAPARAVAALTALLRELVPPEDSGS
jgi:hypothetical protein